MISSTPRRPLLIVLLGPTASGKTELGIQIAKQLKICIHNVDSRQLYKGMDVGTAKPTKSQRREVEHKLIDLRSPDKPITLKEFHEVAQLSIEKSFANKNIALIVGGSGLYIKAITSGLIPPAVSPQIGLRNQLSQISQKECHQILKICDEKAAARISSMDQIRTQRALEVFYATGKAMTEQEGKNPPPWEILEIGMDPKDLKTRISSRTNEIYKNGLLQETKMLADKFSKNLPILKTIGYGEALQVLEKKIKLCDAISLTTRRTSQLAKKQRTWFKRKHSPIWINNEEPLREALSLIESVLR